MIYRAFIILLLLSGVAQAQHVGVILNSSGTAVVGANPSGTPISTSDSRWLAWQTQNNTINTNIKYNTVYAALIAPGFALTSSSLSCSPCYFPIDNSTLQNLSLQYQSIVNDAIIQASIATDGTMTVSSIYSPPALAVNQYIYGTGVPTSAQIVALGSGTGGTGTYTISPAPSTSIATEYIFSGGLGTGWVTGSTYPIQDISGNLHSFNPVQFLNYRSALGVLANCSEQAWLANSQAFPSNCTLTATIP
jgi:hypothetical protein